MKLRAAVVVLALALLAPGVALADDATLVAAYRSNADELKSAGEAYLRVARRASRRPTAPNLRRVIRADRRLNGVLDRIGDAVAAEDPSSDEGRRAKAAATREIRLFIEANRYEMRALRAAIRGRRARANRLLRVAGRRIQASYRAGRAARKAFRDAGLDPGKGVTRG